MTIPLDYPTNVTKKSRDVKTLHADFSVFICRFFFYLSFDVDWESTLFTNNQVVPYYS